MKLRLLAISLLVSVGCSVEEADTSWEDQVIPDMPADDMGFSDAGLGEGPGAGTMTGIWLQGAEGSSCVLGEEQVTHTYFIVEIEQTDRVLDERRIACRIQPSELLGLKIVIPDAAREAIVYDSPGYGQITKLLVGGGYTSPQEIALWGVELDDPYLDLLPTDPDDPRVIDGDNDGQPGLTFTFEGSDCERYSSQKQITQYFGFLTQPNEVIGTSVQSTDIAVYGSSQQLCGIAANVQPNDEYNTFRMVRIDGRGGSINLDADGSGDIDCSEVANYLEEVLPVRPPNAEYCNNQ